MAGKRSRAATKGLRPSKTITASQRKARKLNIEVARKAKKHGKSASQIKSKLKSGAWKKGGSSYLRSSEAAYYLRERGLGRSKSVSRVRAIKRTEGQAKRLIKAGVFKP